MEKKLLILILFVFFTKSSSAFALPQNSRVIEGIAKVFEKENELKVSAKDRSILHWDSFSIAAQEKVYFELPNKQAAILNRVIGEDPSQIFGELHSNGSVYLINPHGILIGKEGVISATHFLASTLDVANQDFLEGKILHFFGTSKSSVENQGKIHTAGDATFLAYLVKNSGKMDSGGVIALGAGKEILYLPQGDERIQILIHPEEEKNIDLHGVHQTGSISGFHAELKADGNLYGYAIKNEGMIEATGFEVHDGQVFLVAEKGVTNNSGSIHGDEIRILGEHVRIFDGSRIDASNAGGGGTILIGGDFQGKNPEVANALSTFVDHDVTISADALDCGDGGRVIVWADDITGFHGKVNVCAGPQGGNGGFVEISGKNNLDYWGLVSAAAPLGKQGMLLLDPSNTTISTGANANVTFTACPVGTYAVTANNAVINNASLVTNLGSTCNITISTSAAGTQAGTLTIANDVIWATNNSLTLNANSGITVNSGVTVSNTSNAASLTFNSGTTATSTLTISSGATVSLIGSGVNPSGTLTLNSNAIATSDMTITGTVTATNKNLVLSTADDFTLTATTGAINFNAPSHNFTFDTTVATNSVANFNGSLTINGPSVFTTAGTLSINEGLTTSGTGTMAMNSQGTVTFGSTSVVSYGSTGALTVFATGSGSDITLSGSFTVPAGGPNVTFSPNDNFTLTAGTGTISYAGAAGNTFSITPGGTTAIVLNGSVNVTGGNFSAISNDSTTIATTGSLGFNSSGGTCTLNSLVGDVNINGTLTIDNGELSVTAFDDFMIDDGATFTHNSSSTSTIITASGGDGDILIDGIMNVTAGSITMTANGVTGSITQNIAPGSITWSSPGTLSMNATDITLNGDTTFSNGNALFTAIDDLTVGTTGNMTWNSPGMLTLATTGTAASDVALNGIIMNFTNGALTIDAMGSIVTGTASTINYTSPGNLSMLSRLGAIDLNAAINLNTSALVSVTTLAGDFSVNGLISNSSTGNIIATIFDDMIIGGAGETIPSQLTTSGGIIQIDAGSLTVQASTADPGATATLGPATNIIANVNEAISVIGLGIGDASIQSTGPLSMTAGDYFLVQGSAFVTANGNLTARANNITLTRDVAPLVRVETTQGDLLLIANQNFTAIDAHVANFGPGDLTIVVDQQAPFPPEVDLGQFNLLGSSTLMTTGGRLGIFTALPQQNQIIGLINGASLEQGEQVFGVWYSTFTGSSSFPFTIYYKLSSDSTSFINLGIVNAQMIQQMLDRTLGWAWMSPFFICNSSLYSPKERWLFKRKPFEYPIYLSEFECADSDPERVTIDPYRFQF